MCVKECPQTTGKEICLYDGFNLEKTTFCYTEIATDPIGLYCYPEESGPRAKVDSYLSNYSNLSKRLIGDIFSVFF